jgi:hypothetical protein
MKKARNRGPSEHRRRRSAHVQAAVDGEVRAGRIAAFLGGQPGDDRRDLARLAQALDGMVATILSSTSWRIALTMSVPM